MKRMGKEFEGIPFGKERTIETMERQIDKLSLVSSGSLMDQEAAERLLIREELERIRQIALGFDDFDPREMSLRDFEMLVEGASKLGFDVHDVSVRYVDNFPEPFHEKEWSFFNADRADESKYGIPFGIYVKKDSAIPLYTTFLLCHEIVHVAVGKKGSSMIARGLEEGLAELLGCLYLFPKLKGRELASNLMIYNRLGYPPDPFWEVYVENLRQAIVLYHHFGLSGLKEMVQGGRRMVKTVEKQILKGEYEEIGLAKGEWDPDVDYLTSRVLTYPRSYVVSPLAKHLSTIIRAGDTISKVLSDNAIDSEQGEHAIKELGQRLFLVVIKDGVIANCDVDTISDRSLLRYLID